MNDNKISRVQVEQFFDLLKTKLSAVPEVQSAITLANEHPDKAQKIYQEYLEIILQIPLLTTGQLTTIRNARNSLNKGNEAISASHSDSKGLLEATLGKIDIPQAALRSLDQTSQYFVLAVDELAKRLEGGHAMKVSGKQPVDGDPESDRVIWGHTKMDNANALLHFVICHYLERYVSEELKGQSIAIGFEKDYFLNAMTDVLILDYLGSNKYADLMALWMLPKDQGGLGWISIEMVAAYK